MRFVIIVLLSVVMGAPALGQQLLRADAPASAGQRMQIMIGSLAGENAELAARLDQAMRDIVVLRKELDDAKKASASKPATAIPSVD